MDKKKIDLKVAYKSKSEFYKDTNKEENDEITNAYDLNRKGNFCGLKDRGIIITNIDEVKFAKRIVNHHVCECMQTTEVNLINNKWICTICNRPIHQ